VCVSGPSSAVIKRCYRWCCRKAGLPKRFEGNPCPSSRPIWLRLSAVEDLGSCRFRSAFGVGWGHRRPPNADHPPFPNNPMRGPWCVRLGWVGVVSLLLACPAPSGRHSASWTSFPLGALSPIVAGRYKSAVERKDLEHLPESHAPLLANLSQRS